LNFEFQTSKDDLSKVFDKFGQIKDIQLPKCKDARFPNSCAGFAFIQYSGRNSARSAVDEMNFSQFKGRKIAVDWTLNKDDYISQNSAGKNE
jgi:RNA recognition motif-containing protein